MSSAKTIADIIAFSELLDLRAVGGNPFSSQPIYIAACAFLQESASDSSSTIASLTPPNTAVPGMSLAANVETESPTSGVAATPGSSENGPSDVKGLSGKPSNQALAQQDYQRCYKAVKAIETYWQGVRYILTVMDQKVKGIMDPLLYTNEDMEAVEIHRWGAGVWNRFAEKLKPNTKSAVVSEEGSADSKQETPKTEIFNNPSALGFQNNWNQGKKRRYH